MSANHWMVLTVPVYKYYWAGEPRLPVFAAVGPWFDVSVLICWVFFCSSDMLLEMVFVVSGLGCLELIIILERDYC